MKGRIKRMVSGLLTAVTVLSSVMQPIVSYAASPDNLDTKPPLYEEVKELLDAEEVVTVKDHEIELGARFDVDIDFTGLEIVDDTKVKVVFQEAVNEAGQDFSTEKADTFTAVYYVEPQNTAHPTYQISRKLIVKEQATASQSEKTGEDDADGEQEETTEDTEAEPEPVKETETEQSTDSANEEAQVPLLNETELDTALEESEEQDTVDETSGLSLSDVLQQGAEEGIDLLSLEENETVTFMAYSNLTRSSQSVSVTKGTLYYYSDYGLGSYLTEPYTVKFGSVTATAYCVQPSKTGPCNGVYTITKLSDGKALAKVCYYGTKAAGDEGFFAEKHPDFSAGKRFIITHMAAAYANNSGDAFYGTNETGKALAMELYNYCMAQPDIPDVAMSFSKDDVKAYRDGNSQRTEDITFKADALQTITMKLPNGVKFHNVTTGKTSEAGADVNVSGGTKFYLTAPLAQTETVSGSWSSTMKGSITKDYSAYKITTGEATQDLALVFGEGVDDEKYVDFKVSWIKEATVSIVKKDTGSGVKLAGAVYGIYSDGACTKLITKMPATDSNGASSVTIEKTQDTVYLKEITAPKGYRVSTSATNVKLVVGSTTSKSVSDEEQLASLTVYKMGEVLTGAAVTADGVSFSYTAKKQAGAVYDVYANENILAADGSTVYKKGALVKSNLITGSDGSATLDKLHLGSYLVKETKAPNDLVCKGETQTITLSYAGQNEEKAVGSVTFTNDRQRAKVSVVKQDKDTKKPLPGGIYGIFAGTDIKNSDGTVVVTKDTFIEKVTTGADGTAVYQSDLPIGNGYYVKELQAPVNYYRNSDTVYSFLFQYTTDQEAEVAFTHTFENERVDATISLEKKDKETGEKPQGDATLEGAVYGLYAREDIVHPDGKTGSIFKAGALVATLITDKNGKAEIKDLYLGKYYVKEITPPTGYLLDEAEHDVDCRYEGDTVKTVKRTAVSEDVVIKQPFQVIKAANNGHTDAELLKGVGFTAYLVSSLDVKEDGSYDFSKAVPVIMTADGKTEMFTDEKGYACSIALPYGVYIVRETTTPHNFLPVDDFMVTISENHPTTPQTWRVLLDDEFEAKLKIIKKDDETKQPVLLAGTEFKVYDLEEKKYVEQVTTYPTTTVHKSYFTDQTGYLILPQNLSPGHYRIEEVTAPDGYTVDAQYVEIHVDSNTAYLMDAVSGDAIIEVSYENHPVKGELTIVKKGEILSEFDKDFKYEETNLEGAVFEIYAAEDIYSADHQKDAEGNRNLAYAKDTVVTTVTTDENGKATLGSLPLGKYRIEEVTAPFGYTLQTTSQEITFVYAGQDIPVVAEEVIFTNDRQKVSLVVEKQDAETGNTVAGAVFGIYNTEDILVGEKVLVKADTLLQEMTSDAHGQAVCTLDLPFGKYCVKELKAPEGYVSSDEVLNFEASYQGQDKKTVELKAVKKNEPTTTEFKKSDITTGVELDGAYLSVIDKNGDVVDSWTSKKEDPHIIKNLAAGETYILREEFAPYGYLKATDIEFTVLDTAEVQKVEMKDEVPTALLIINKKGEFLDDISLLDQTAGLVEHIFAYVTGSLEDVTFEVYAAEDIKAADGVSEDYYKTDELIATITTDEKGNAQVDDLPVGKYYVKETTTAHGYVLDGEIRYVDLSYRDQDTPVVTFDEEWQNERQKVSVNVRKKEKDSEKVLKGAVFGLYSREDILSASGKVLLKADELIEERVTDDQGMLTFTADLPIDGTYYVKEQKAPDGYVKTDEEQEFTFTYQGEEFPGAVFDFVFENETTKVQISKTDIAGKELPGAKLTILDAKGKVVESWTSTEEAYYIEKLPVGKYTLKEESAPEGYLVAEDVAFEVKNTGEIQHVTMVDEAKPVEKDTPEKTSDTPKTGDDSNVKLWLLLMALGLAGSGASAAMWIRKKKK